MERKLIISNLENYFLKYLNCVNNENSARLNFSIKYLSNQIEFKSYSNEFRIVINKSFNNDFTYKIINDKLNEIVSYKNDRNEKSNHDVIKSFFHVFISINGENEFKFFLKKCLDEYNVFLISHLVNKINIRKNKFYDNSTWNLQKNPKPIYYVKTIIHDESNDSGKIGGDSRRTIYTTVSFKLVASSKNLNEKDKKQLEEFQKKLDKNNIYKSETFHFYGSAGESSSYTTEFLDLNLSRYIKHDYLNLYNLPISNYEREISRNNLFKEVDNDIKTLKLFIFSLFFNVNDLKNTNYHFLGLIDYLIEPENGGNILAKIDSTYIYILSLIYDENKTLVESCLYSKFSEDDIVNSINDYYINCSSKIQLFALDPLYFAFKIYYE